MAYTPNPTWNSGAAPGIDAPALNHIETQYTESSLSLEQDLFTAYVISGMVCTKDGTTPSQLDVTAGVAWLLQSVDNTLRRQAPTATTFSTTGHASTTMYLDLNPDGTFSWGTAHSGVANHLTICTVTTDGSANIGVITDTRTTFTNFLAAMIGTFNLPTGTQINSANPVLQGAHSNAGRPTISVGNGAPSSLAANEVYIQLT